MKLTVSQLFALGGLFLGAEKRAQAEESDIERSEAAPPAPFPKKEKTGPSWTHAYPDYGRSMVSQYKQDPRHAGLVRGAETGALGAVLGALLARLASNKGSVVGLGALTGATAMAIPGYVSGKEEAKSDYTKLLALRRMGIQTPADLEAAQEYPQLLR